MSASAGCRTIDTGAPLWTPVPDSSISRPIVVCRDADKSLRHRATSLDPLSARNRPTSPAIATPAPVHRLQITRIFYCVPPSKQVGAVGFRRTVVNRTRYSFVLSGDKSRFLTLCYRLLPSLGTPSDTRHEAKPESSLSIEKHRQFNVFFGFSSDAPRRSEQVHNSISEALEKTVGRTACNGL